MDAVVDRARQAFDAGTTRPLSWRMLQLRALHALVTDNAARFKEALAADLGSGEFFSETVELDGVCNEALDALDNVHKWMKDEAVGTPLVSLPGSSKIMRQPYGVALVISPWNYPVSLALSPCVAALAAGNAVVLKPSEVSVHTSALLGELVPAYLDREAVQVVQGGVPETTELLRQRFDVIMYTGSTQVGRVVMRAAAEHLTPVILELGGKSPCVVAADADVPNAARRIAWGKWTMNMGQTCVSPDYILTTPAVERRLVDELKKTIGDFFGADPQTSADVSRIINERHTRRLAALLEDDPTVEVLAGGHVDVGARYMAPTVVRATPESKVMQDEIFGPILPILVVPDVAAAIAFVNERPRPLALYVFSGSRAVQDSVLQQTTSGGASVNDVVLHVGNPNLPFGGVGPSGMGAYHGRHGFEAFSHRRGVYTKFGADAPIRFPPYTPSKLTWLRRLRTLNPTMLRNVALLTGVCTTVALIGYINFALMRRSTFD